MSRAVPPAPARDRVVTRIDDLPGRLQDVLRLLAAGKSNAEIADELYVSIATVRGHVSRLYTALCLPAHSGGHCSSRVRAARWYWKQIHEPTER